MADDGFGRLEAREQCIEGSVAVALRQATVALGHEQRYVRVDGMRQTEQLLQVELLGRGAQEVHAAHHRGDALGRVVHHHGQLVGERAVRALHEEVSAVGGEVLSVGPLHLVDEGDLPIGHDEALRGHALLRADGALPVAQMPAGARVHRLLTAMRRRSRVQVGARAEAGVHKAALAQLVVRGPVGLRAVVLEVWPFVPSQPQRFEVALHGIDVDGLRALGVEVLDAQHDAATLRLGHEPCRQRRKHVPRMHPPRRRRSEPPHHGSGRRGGFHAGPSTFSNLRRAWFCRCCARCRRARRASPSHPPAARP